MRQEFAMAKLTEGGATEMNSDEIAEWLLSPAEDGIGLPEHSETERWLNAAKDALDQRLASASNQNLHPENRQWTAAAWWGDAPP